MPLAKIESSCTSPAMTKVLARVRRLASSTVPVLLVGESGTGKGVVARLIHAIRGETRPFVTIDCSTLPDHLIESELFGCVRGAFTGATESRPGLIESANGGTAFFDEISELPIHLQAKLLRVLQDREYRPVGSATAKRASFCLIAATNRNLAAEVESGRFREDLYYRLGVAPIQIPPLRERRDDIPALVDTFARAFGSGPVPNDVVERLCTYSWPGNVRQLEHCIQCMVQVRYCPLLGDSDAEGCVISAACMRCADGSADSVPVSAASSGLSAITIAEREKLAIIEALRSTGGHHSKAARLLGIGRTTLYRKMRKYGTGPAMRGSIDRIEHPMNHGQVCELGETCENGDSNPLRLFEQPHEGRTARHCPARRAHSEPVHAY